MNIPRLFFKKNYPRIYEHIRSLLFPIHAKLTAQKRASFLNRQTKILSHDGVQFSIVLDPNNGFVDQEIFTNGVYEPDILSVVKKNLIPGGTFIDIGANIGQHSLFAACVVGEKGSVIAFEPIPRLVAQVTESIALNKMQNRVTILPFACSDNTGTLTLKIRPGNIGGSSLHHNDSSFETASITTTKADLHLLNVQAPALIKIDTEGHEVEALRGLHEFIDRVRPTMIIEYSPSLRPTTQHEYADGFFSILEHKYNFYDLEAGHKIITNPRQWASTFTKAQTNLLCVAK